MYIYMYIYLSIYTETHTCESVYRAADGYRDVRRKLAAARQGRVGFFDADAYWRHFAAAVRCARELAALGLAGDTSAPARMHLVVARSKTRNPEP